MHIRKIMITVLAGIMFLCSFSIFFPIETCSAGSTIHVYSGQSIQSAINSANESGGDTVYVHSGEYSLPLTIDRPLTLTGDGSSPTISGSGDHTIEVTANGVDISGFTIENSGGSFSSILLSSISNCEISNNIISNAGNGIYVVNSNSNTINDNSFDNSNIGIYFLSSDSNTIFGNSFQYHNANGIFLDSNSDDNTIYLNDFNDKDDGYGDNARDDGTNNWDYNSQGNYWDDYNDYDNNPQDGIGDNPYSISGSGGNQDNYPKGDFLSLNQDPVAFIDSITPNPATQGLTVTFNGRGEDDGSIVVWEWKANGIVLSTNSEDYSTSSLSAGTYTISYRVKDDDENWSPDVEDTLVINSQSQKPTAVIFKPDLDEPINYGLEVEFRGQGFDPDGGQPTEYYWRSSIDDFLSSSREFIQNDLTIGAHTIYFKVKDDEGEWSSEVSTTVTIQSDPSNPNNPPVANAGGPYSGYISKSFTFDGSSSSDPDIEDSITSYYWDFGDESTGEGVSPEHTYTSEGNYTVELTVTDSNGAQSKITTYVNIGLQPNGQNGDNGTGDKGIPGFEVIFVIMAIAAILFFKRYKRT